MLFVANARLLTYNQVTAGAPVVHDAQYECISFTFIPLFSSVVLARRRTHARAHLPCACLQLVEHVH